MSAFGMLIKSTKTANGYDLSLEGDVRLHLSESLHDLTVTCEDFDKVFNAYNHLLVLCDNIDQNDGMLEPAVKAFVNQNNELADALGISLSMEEDAVQDPEKQKEEGKQVTEKKQGIFRRMWEAIKKFVRMVLDAVASFFHWIGNLFAGTSKKIEWIKSDGIKIAAKLANVPKENVKSVSFGHVDNNGNTPFIVRSRENASESMTRFSTESIGAGGAIAGGVINGGYSSGNYDDDSSRAYHKEKDKWENKRDRKLDDQFREERLISTVLLTEDLYSSFSNYCNKIPTSADNLVNAKSDGEVKKYQEEIITAGKELASSITTTGLIGNHNSGFYGGKVSVNEEGKISIEKNKILDFYLDPYDDIDDLLPNLAKNIEIAANFINKYVTPDRNPFEDTFEFLPESLRKFNDALWEKRQEEIRRNGGSLNPFNWYKAPVQTINKSLNIMRATHNNGMLILRIYDRIAEHVNNYVNVVYRCLKKYEQNTTQH